MHVNELDTPALVVDLDILTANIREMADYCRGHGLGLRPHAKTHKTPEIARMQLGAGACGVTVAKLGEAELLAGEGIDDILIAYPIVGESKLKRLAGLAAKARITVSTDSLEVAQAVSKACRHGGAKAGILAEMDAGMHRCGVGTTEELTDLAHAMSRLEGVEFLGFLFYPGQIRVPPAEQVPVLLAIDALVKEAQDRLFRSGIEVQVVSGGSTPTAYRSHEMKTVTEIRPGTYVFNDMNTVCAGSTDIRRCALTVLVTVVSTAVPGRAVVDGGSKTFSSDLLLGGSGRGFGYCRERPEVVLESMTEEHGHLNVESAAGPLKIGDRLSFIPNHACTTLNMHGELWGTRNDEVVERWTIKGRGLIR